MNHENLVITDFLYSIYTKCTECHSLNYECFWYFTRQIVKLYNKTLHDTYIQWETITMMTRMHYFTSLNLLASIWSASLNSSSSSVYCLVSVSILKVKLTICLCLIRFTADLLNCYFSFFCLKQDIFVKHYALMATMSENDIFSINVTRSRTMVSFERA